jgi:hypothetical protein
MGIKIAYHHQETVSIDGTDESGDDEAVPALVRLVHQRVSCVCQEKRDGDHAHVLEGDLVVLISLFLGLRQLVLVLEYYDIREDAAEAGVRTRLANTNIDSLGNLPELNRNAHTLTEENHPRGVLVIVKEIEEDDGLHDNVGEDGADRHTNVVLLLAPVTDITLERKQLEDHVQDTDDRGRAEQVHVGVEEDFLEHLHFTAIATTWRGLTLRGLASGLLHALIHRSHYTELPVGER